MRTEQEIEAEIDRLEQVMQSLREAGVEIDSRYNATRHARIAALLWVLRGE